MNSKKAEMIEKKADEARQKLKKPNKCNIDVKELMQAYNIYYIPKELPDNVSGASMSTESRKQIIVVNKYQPEKRKKFTIAHELGHLILGHDAPLNIQDKAIGHDSQPSNPSQILFRDDKTSEGSDWREVEANHFAASLLMPKYLLNKEINRLIQNNPRNYLSEYNVHELAETFGVSAISMSIRLSRLGFI